MQSKYETEKANETVNLVNEKIIMFVSKNDYKKGYIKFDEEDYIDIQEFNEELQRLVKGYELIVGEINHEFSIENENLVKTKIGNVTSEIYLRENEEDYEEIEYFIKIYLGDGPEPTIILFEDVFCACCTTTKSVLHKAIVTHDEYLVNCCGAMSPIVEQSKIAKSDRTNRGSIDKFLKELAGHLKKCKLVSIDSSRGSVYERNLKLRLKQNQNELSLRNDELSIIFTLTPDESTLTGNKTYTVRQGFEYEYRPGINRSHHDITYHQSIEEALNQVFSLLNRLLNQELESDTYFVEN